MECRCLRLFSVSDIACWIFDWKVQSSVRVMFAVSCWANIELSSIGLWFSFFSSLSSVDGEEFEQVFSKDRTCSKLRCNGCLNGSPELNLREFILLFLIWIMKLWKDRTIIRISDVLEGWSSLVRRWFMQILVDAQRMIKFNVHLKLSNRQFWISSLFILIEELTIFVWW